MDLVSTYLNEKGAVSNSREFIKEVRLLATRYNVNFFIVTDGASAISNNGNKAIKHARDEHIKWEIANGHNPYEDWGEK